MSYCQHYRSPVDDTVYIIGEEPTIPDAERLAGLYHEVTLRHWLTVNQVAVMAQMMALAECGFDPDRVLELERRGEELRHDCSLLLEADEMSMAELLGVVARSAENFQWLVDQLPVGEKRAKAEADLADWKARMIPLLDRLGRPKGRPVLRRRRLT